MLSKFTLSLRDIYAAGIVTAVILAGTGFSSAPANADVITVGAANGSGQGVLNGQANGHTRYQQVYGTDAFNSTGGPIYINSLTFFAAKSYFIPIPGFPGGGMTIPLSPQSQSIASGDYTIRLSTTDSAVDGLVTSFNSNWGDDVDVFFSGSLSNTLTIAGETPFLYDPTMGNLLLDITVNSQTSNGGQLLNYHESLAQFNRGQTDEMSSRTGSGANAISTGLPWTRSTGYVTEFGYTTQVETSAAIPEPGTIALLGIGLLAFTTALRRRRTGV
jgi:hypothetical protein